MDIRRDVGKLERALARYNTAANLLLKDNNDLRRRVALLEAEVEGKTIMISALHNQLLQSVETSVGITRRACTQEMRSVLDGIGSAEEALYHYPAEQTLRALDERFRMVVLYISETALTVSPVFPTDEHVERRVPWVNVRQIHLRRFASGFESVVDLAAIELELQSEARMVFRGFATDPNRVYELIGLYRRSFRPNYAENGRDADGNTRGTVAWLSTQVYSAATSLGAVLAAYAPTASSRLGGQGHGKALCADDGDLTAFLSDPEHSAAPEAREVDASAIGEAVPAADSSNDAESGLDAESDTEEEAVVLHLEHQHSAASGTSFEMLSRSEIGEPEPALVSDVQTSPVVSDDAGNH